jgi:hypothetical protein
VTKVVVLSTDLIDRSKISSALPDAVFVGAAAQLPAAAAGADLVVVDASRPGVLDVLAAVVAAADEVVAFGPHVDTETLAAASASGARVLPRSKFFADVAAAVGRV